MKPATPQFRLFMKIIESFFATWALMKASRMEPGNILTLIIFLLCLLFFGRLDKMYQEETPWRKPAQKVSGFLAGLFTILFMAVDSHTYIESLTNHLFRAMVLAAVFLGFLFIFYHVLMFLYFYTANIPALRKVLFTNGEAIVEPVSKDLPLWKRGCSALVSFYKKQPGLCGFLLCMLCWLPYFLYLYPGVMTPDSINQFEQVLGLISYSNHHPWAHTLLFKLFYTIGYGLTGNMVVAVSFFTFFQMTVMALTVWYFINTLKKYSFRPWIGFLCTLFYALVPYHAVFVVTLWKDILFAAAVLLFGCSILRILKEKTVLDVCVFAVSGLMLCLFRSNGWYGMLLCLPFLLVYFRKQKRFMFPAIISFFLITIFFKYPVMNACSVTQPDFIEALCIPTQQIAAVLYNHRELTDKQMDLIEHVVGTEYIDELYDPTYADNMKELVRAGNQDYLIAHKGDFLKLWFQLALKYPGDYIQAYIYQTYGYWYPDAFYDVAIGEGVSSTSLGVSATPLLRGPLVVKAKEISIKLGSMLPLYGTLWSMGVVCWIFLICIGNVLIRGEKKKLILYLPSFAILLTVLIATPVATEFRYVYFMIFSFPFYVVTSLLPVAQEKK